MNKNLAVVLLIVITLAFPVLAGAQESASESFAPGSGNVSFGFDLLDRAGSFGIGAEITSPYFIWERLAVRARGELIWDEFEWNIFSLARAGIVAVGGYLNDSVRLYGEGGVVFAFLPVALTDKDFVFGGYGHFGFEFLMNTFDHSHLGYFIELGANGINIHADKLADQSLVNGFATTTGLRFYFF